jgi:hypothetical protein
MEENFCGGEQCEGEIDSKAFNLILLLCDF